MGAWGEPAQWEPWEALPGEGAVCTTEDTWARQAQWGPKEHWPRGRVLQRAPLVSALLTAQMGSPDRGWAG